MDSSNSAENLSVPACEKSPFASATQSPERTVTDVPTSQALQLSGPASPGNLAQAGSRLTTASAFRSPASWFNRTTSPASGSNPKHSLLAMVPPQPLTRPTASAPPSPPSHLQPPTIPALDQLKQNHPSATLPAAPPSTAATEPTLSAPQPGDQPAAQSQKPESDSNADTGKQLQQEPDASKQAKRDKRLRKTEANMRWQLMRKLADISADVELLNHEVTRIRYEQSTALLTEEQRELGEQEEQQLTVLQQKRLADLVLRQCATCLKSVTAHKWAFPFAMPVDVTLFKDYPNIIKEPMDFATIKAKVEGGLYKGPQQFYDDMKLVFTNARRYNPPGSDVNLMASGVEEKFEERWQALLTPKLAEEQTHAHADAAAVRKQRLDQAQARLAGELEQHRVRLLSVFDNLHSRIMDARTLAAAACKPVSQQDKEALLPALEALRPEHFEWAMSLVHARYPGLPTGPGEEMQFDITCLDSLALRQLMDLTQACISAAKMAEGGEVQVTWPANPVGTGSRGHKPASNKSARRSPTPPTPLSPNPTAQAGPALPPTHQPQNQASLPAQGSAPILSQTGSAPAQHSPAVQTGSTLATSLPPVPGAAAGASPVLPQSAAPQTDTLGPVLPPVPSQIQTVTQATNAQNDEGRPNRAGLSAAPPLADPSAQPSSQAPTAALGPNPARPLPLLPSSVQARPDARAGPSSSAQQDSAAQMTSVQGSLPNRQAAPAGLADTAGDQAVTQSTGMHQGLGPGSMLGGQLQKDIAQEGHGSHRCLRLSVADFTGATGGSQPIAMDVDSQGAKGNQAAVSSSEAQPRPDSSIPGSIVPGSIVPGSTLQAPDSHALSRVPDAQQLTAASQHADSEGQTELHPTHVQPPQVAHTQVTGQSQAQREPEEEGSGAEGSQQNGQRSQAVAAVGRASSDGLDFSPAAAELLPVGSDTVPAHDEQQQQQRQHLSGQGSLEGPLQGSHPSPMAQPLQKRRRPDAGASAAAEEAVPAQEQASASKVTEGSTAGDDADDTDGDEDAEGAMQMQSEPSQDEDNEGKPVSAPVVTETAEVNRSAQPARRRQAPQRQTTPTPLASRGARGSSGRKAAGRGGGGRGRASTPAAKAAAVQKPRRSTSRITAGKRRRSP